jgi:hypothetical protein
MQQRTPVGGHCDDMHDYYYSQRRSELKKFFYNYYDHMVFMVVEVLVAVRACCHYFAFLVLFV